MFFLYAEIMNKGHSSWPRPPLSSLIFLSFCPSSLAGLTFSIKRMSTVNQEFLFYLSTSRFSREVETVGR